MNAWLNYILEANAGLLLFLLVYRLLLQHETQFTYKRAYLIAGIVFSLTFPLITMPAGNDIIPSIGYSISTEWTDIPSYTGMEQMQNPQAALNGWTLLTYGYLSVVFILSLRLLYQVAKVLSMVARHRSSGNVVTIDNPHVYAFSFFRYIFISSAHAIPPDEKERIIQHETVHIRKWHSVDMLLIEVVRILFWFNPLLTWYKNELSTVHEYEADAVSVKPDEIDQYCSLLAKSAIASAGLTLANHFNNSLTLKRIAMMKTIKKRMKQWKTLFILAFTTLFFVAVSCQDQIVSDNVVKQENSGDTPTISQVLTGENVVTIIFSNVTNEEANNNLIVSHEIRSEGGKPIVIGKITSGGRPMPDVYFGVAGEPFSRAITDKSGNFKLELPEDSFDAVLSFESVITLDEISVIAYRNSER